MTSEVQCKFITYVHLVSSPLTVTLKLISTGAGLLSCNCTAVVSGRLCSSLTHDPFTDAFGMVYKLWVKATSMNPRQKKFKRFNVNFL